MLIVDDEAAVRRALALLFASYGMDTHTARGAVDAREQIARRPFDILCIDLFLRDGRGDDLYRDITDVDPAYRSRTLFMTGDISVDAERALAETGCPYLMKPFDGALAFQAIAALRGGSFYPDPGLCRAPST